jgi:transcriptional regulator with XRE-family HTH domain
MYQVKNQAPNNKVIKTIRDKLNLSQKEMADLLSTEQSRLSKIERGKHTPDWLVKFATLARLLNDAGLSWEDVILDLPDNLAVSEDKGEYNA